MSFDMDEDILQDFLVEAGEILELLQEQLVELENNPQDTALLNAIFRGFHTVKGGAGFLSLGELVDACHGAENVFDILRTGKRQVTPELMDVILQALDAVNAMFAEVKARQPLTPADPALLDALHFYSEPERPGEAAPNAAPAAVSPKVEAPVTPSAPAVAASGDDDLDSMTEAEFERMLDELHGAGAPGRSATAAPTPSAAPASGDDITDDEFEALLDQLHGKGSFQPEVKAPPAAPTSAATPATPASATKKDDEITDDEFEALLDQLHGKGKAPVEAAPKAEVERQPTPEPVAAPAAVPAKAAEAPVAPAAGAAADKGAVAAETTVRGDTKRLDQIMNMVGELVLVRNRLVSLSSSAQSEEMSKAIANLDVVTADIQGAVMKTRMQPIKKVFGRFPRVVRDLARSLKKDIELILEGEETDLDKNLVEALADPLVHLVRNSVDHGIELPDIRQAAGKPRTGIVKLAAQQAGDHILLTIQDDGAGMDPEKLKNLAIKRGVIDTDTAARMSDTDAFNLIFAPGFSTKEQISDISGRGVGMDVVKTKITQLNGTVHIHSKLGEGTLLEIDRKSVV